ncbi:uncharacterized protein LOC119397934 [Rhipicephalus sanguineus]|uniref:uncharacterized protein LOC119397934 n=1 Tax=Rhipicephalus sanguineus TaxID=34632 RepID=UPI001892D917|nr:uncharacterized protein LOC119397934 [Rhipicephalus sanguineus]
MKFLISSVLLFVRYDTPLFCFAEEKNVDAEKLLQVRTPVKYILAESTDVFFGLNSPCMTLEMVNSTPPYLVVLDYKDETHWKTLVYTAEVTSFTAQSSTKIRTIITFTARETEAVYDTESYEVTYPEELSCFVLSPTGAPSTGCSWWKKLQNSHENHTAHCPVVPEGDSCNALYERCRTTTGEDQCLAWL